MEEHPDLFPERLDQRVSTPAYLPPEAFPLSDPRKAEIRLGQLLAFSACIRGNEPGSVHGEPRRFDPPGADGWQAMVDSVALGLVDIEHNGTATSARTLWCGSGGHALYVVPSLELVIWKLGGWDGQYEASDTGLETHPAAARAADPRPDWRETADAQSALRETLRLVLAAVAE